MCRSQLPAPMFSRTEVSVWSILKQCVGKVLKFQILFDSSHSRATLNWTV
jgi:hypothetical protein